MKKSIIYIILSIVAIAILCMIFAIAGHLDGENDFLTNVEFLRASDSNDIILLYKGDFWVKKCSGLINMHDFWLDCNDCVTEGYDAEEAHVIAFHDTVVYIDN